MRRTLFLTEILIISALVIVTRCANYGDVFFGGQIYFVDADCYSRMTRARICFEHPGTVVRRHDFENFSKGTSPHTTAPFDYLIVALATTLTPLSKNALDLAGAVVSPLLSIALGIFLCWWSRRMRLRFRWALLILYAVSPVLAHGFALGRPDHQSLLIVLITIALCAEWSLAFPLEGRAPASPASQSSALQSRAESSKRWSIVSGASWALAFWVSLYEPLILLLLIIAMQLLRKFAMARAPSVRAGLASAREARALPRSDGVRWLVFAGIVAIAFLIERRIPEWPSREFVGALKNWSAAVGELTHVSLANTIWFSWCGWLLLLAPILLWPKWNRNTPLFLIALLMTTFALTIWQARWSYFFVTIFAMVAPEILSVLRKPLFAATVFIIALLPIAEAWDHAFADEELARRAESKIEQFELRAISSQIDGAFIAPWWFSPALSYWSRQAAVGGSSHESIGGIVETAKFFETQNAEEAMQIIGRQNVRWIVAYDADRVAQNSALILGHALPQNAFCYLLDRRPSEVPPFLRLIAQTGRCKLFRVGQS